MHKGCPAHACVVFCNTWPIVMLQAFPHSTLALFRLAAFIITFHESEPGGQPQTALAIRMPLSWPIKLN